MKNSWPLPGPSRTMGPPQKPPRWPPHLSGHWNCLWSLRSAGCIFVWTNWLVPGHTLALGGETPSPVVDIRVAGQLLAQGRLVDVGGMPGVQITRMHAAGQDGGTPQGAGDGTGRD